MAKSKIFYLYSGIIIFIWTTLFCFKNYFVMVSLLYIFQSVSKYDIHIYYHQGQNIDYIVYKYIYKKRI